MKKLVGIITDCAVIAAILYAVVVIAVVPAAACTTSQCSNLALAAPALCQGAYGCPNGHLTKCDSSGYRIECRNASGGFCGSFGGQCP